jgi:hypothetical protein
MSESGELSAAPNGSSRPRVDRDDIVDGRAERDTRGTNRPWASAEPDRAACLSAVLAVAALTGGLLAYWTARYHLTPSFPSSWPGIRGPAHFRPAPPARSGGISH